MDSVLNAGKEKDESFTCEDFEICFQTSGYFPSCVRSQFRAWVHGCRLTTIIFTELMAKTSTQQQKAHLALPCLSN